MNIIIRDLSDDQKEALEKAKSSLNEKTNSKAVLKMLENYENDQLALKKAIQRFVNAERELRMYKETIKQIQWNIQSGLPEKEDDSEFY
ncbi:hypothetical protein [Christiangramia sp. SM2212]|uniref:Uncharacterized protein n=1 Tax=Christiangramia sediminicola TaxID=3073267 RepID=A0ABU1EPX2_9FLAO|nr:hypothetical protein [Christiangramia sp. SM2212]MDR5590263.1 hypothetical protein [Christiangramia sp. SM2212]